MSVSPLRDLVLIERLEGYGIETVSPGGIIIPATTEARAKTKADTFRARVLAKGPDAPRDLAAGEEVLVFTWADGDGSQLYTGVEVGRHQLFVRSDDIVCVYVDDGPSTVPERAA